MWPRESNLGYGTITRAEPGLWSLPGAFERRYSAVGDALDDLQESVAGRDAAAAQVDLCAVVQACGSCHAAYRLIDTASLIREGIAWLGRYPGCVESRH